jgi:hypothetical protein
MNSPSVSGREISQRTTSSSNAKANLLGASQNDSLCLARSQSRHIGHLLGVTPKSLRQSLSTTVQKST